MPEGKPVMGIISNGPKDTPETIRWMFFCPGCRCGHEIISPPWKFSGNLVKPTIRASILCHENKKQREISKDRYGHRCHSFVTEGKIEFLADCTHKSAGQTVDLPPFNEDDEELYGG